MVQCLVVIGIGLVIFYDRSSIGYNRSLINHNWLRALSIVCKRLPDYRSIVGSIPHPDDNFQRSFYT